MLDCSSSGDRLTDERVQSAQEAMKNAETPLDRLEGFISKIEDFHRMMNFLEVRIVYCLLNHFCSWGFVSSQNFLVCGNVISLVQEV